MTTTKTRPRTKKKTKAKTKKPKWTLVSFKKIEQWREKLGMTKAGMAEALGVTNSTFHNWRRGTTVAHPNQQQEILEKLQALESNAGSAPAAPKVKGKPGPKAKTKVKATKVKATKGKPGPKAKGKTKVSPKARKNAASKADATLASHPAGTKVPRPDIADITVAFIQAQKKVVSPDVVVSFIEQLHSVI